RFAARVLDASEEVQPRQVLKARRGQVHQSFGVNDAREGLGPADRDIEAVTVEEELCPSWRVAAKGGGHGDDHHQRLLTLELVHGADTSPLWQGPAQEIDLHVEGAHDEDVVEAQATAFRAVVPRG